MSSVPASASAASLDMEGMGMGMEACKISMIWNWYTTINAYMSKTSYLFLITQLTDAAGFISQSWQTTSSCMFAGSYIGVICLVTSLEFLRRVQREYDGYLRTTREP
jgi:copper transporter 1